MLHYFLPLNRQEIAKKLMSKKNIKILLKTAHIYLKLFITKYIEKKKHTLLHGVTN